MINVYVVSYYFCEEDILVGVFSEEQKAFEYADNHEELCDVYLVRLDDPSCKPTRIKDPRPHANLTSIQEDAKSYMFDFTNFIASESHPILKGVEG